MRGLPPILLGGVALIAAAMRTKTMRYPLHIEVQPFPSPQDSFAPWADVVSISGMRIGIRPRDGATAEEIRREVASALAQGVRTHLDWPGMED